MNLKVHKPHLNIPPPRPLISGSGSITENIATYVEYHIKEIASEHESYLQDTPDFLRIIDKINRGPKLHKNTMLVTMDVTSLFTNILHDEGLATMKEALDKRENPKVPTNFLIKLMKIILTENIFEFHNQLWRQLIGAAMGSRPVPGYANMFMAKIDKIIKELGLKYYSEEYEALRLLKRFLDDYFLICIGTTKSLHRILKEINKINPTILTMNHTSIENEPLEDRCDCPNVKDIPFLDTLVSIKDGHIDVDLYKKRNRL